MTGAAIVAAGFGEPFGLGAAVGVGLGATAFGGFGAIFAMYTH